MILPLDHSNANSCTVIFFLLVCEKIEKTITMLNRMCQFVKHHLSKSKLIENCFQKIIHFTVNKFIICQLIVKKKQRIAFQTNKNINKKFHKVVGVSR